MGSKEKTQRTQQWVQLFFLVGFSMVALALAIPGLLSHDEGYMEAKLSMAPELVEVGWLRACVGRKGCEEQDSQDLQVLFSKEARDLGRGLVTLLAISCASALFVMTMGLLGVVFDVWCARTTIVVAGVGALAGVTLLFLTPRFSDEILSNLKDRTRSRLDVICDGQVVCSDVFEVDECADTAPPQETRLVKSCEWTPDRLVCARLDGGNFDDCDSARFLKTCGQAKVVCNLDKTRAYIANLGLGLHWLLFGLVVIAIFVPKVKIRRNIHSTQKLPQPAVV